MELELIAALTVVGLLLIAVDFYIPGFVLGTCGVGLMIVATVIFGMQHELTGTLLLACAEILLGGAAAWASIKYFPRTQLGRRLFLQATLEGAQASPNASAQLVGREGVAQTILRPAGAALLDGKRLDVVAESGMIERDSRIKVVAVDGNRIVVRKIESTQT